MQNLGEEMKELLKKVRVILADICKKQGLYEANEQKPSSASLHGSYEIEMGNYDNASPNYDTCHDKYEFFPIITIKTSNGEDISATNLWIDNTKAEMKVLLDKSIMAGGELDAIVADSDILTMTKKEVDGKEAKFEIQLKITAFIERGT